MPCQKHIRENTLEDKILSNVNEIRKILEEVETLLKVREQFNRKTQCITISNLYALKNTQDIYFYTLSVNTKENNEIGYNGVFIDLQDNEVSISYGIAYNTVLIPSEKSYKELRDYVLERFSILLPAY